MENEKALAVVKQLPIITERLEEVSKDIKERTNQAMSLVVTMDNLADIKKVRASLNKEFSDYETLRKQIKNQIMEKYVEFENQYNTLIGDAFKTADNNLKTKINESENKLKTEKENELKEYCNEYAESLHLENYVTWEKLNIKVNLSDSNKKLREQITSKLDIIANEIKIIENDENCNDIMVEYLNDFDFTRAKLVVMNRVMEKNKLEQEKIKREQLEQQEESIIAKVDEEIVVPIEIPVQNAVPIITTRFQVYGTKEQLTNLKLYMQQKDLKFESF